MVETINKTLRMTRTLLQELGREPTPEEVAERLNVSVSRVREVLKISRDPVSLDTRSEKRMTVIWETLSRMIPHFHRQIPQHFPCSEQSLQQHWSL